MRFSFVVVLLFIAPLSGCLTTSNDGQDKLRLATTTSIRDSGLMDVLVEDFESRTDVDVEYVAVGTGAALRLGETGDVDAVIVHSPEQEQQFVDEGFAKEHFNLAHNSFVLLSPSLPTGSVYDAFEHISTSEQCFVSRGDDSGTHAKEQQIWQHLNTTRGLEVVVDANGVHPPGSWYYSIGQGMGAAINMAHEKECTTLSDLGTALAYQDNILLQRYEYDDAFMRNPYSYLIVDELNTTASHTFLSYLQTNGQDVIANYTINGHHAFFVES